jgi:hypothetical protein
MRALAMVFVLSGSACAAPEDWYAKAVKSVEAKVEPATARPGQTVTFTLAIDLNDGYHTYPTVQPDKNAAGMVNAIAFPEPGALVFVGAVIDPAKPDVKAEPALGIKELRTYRGKVVFERKAVVNPKAAAGEATVALKSFKLSVCDADNCFAPRTLKPEAKLAVKGEAMAVAKEYAAEVEKALAGK